MPVCEGEWISIICGGMGRLWNKVASGVGRGADLRREARTFQESKSWIKGKGEVQPITIPSGFVVAERRHQSLLIIRRISLWSVTC